MEYQRNDLRAIVLLDDPTGTTVISDGETRPAKPGEFYSFEALGEALARSTGAVTEVRATLPEILEPGTVLIVPARQLEKWLTDLAVRDSSSMIVMVDAERQSIAQSLTVSGVVAAVERHQYWAWQTGERADASIFGDLRSVSRLHRNVTVTPIDNGPFGRIRIDGEDLPGLLGDYLAAMLAC